MRILLEIWNDDEKEIGRMVGVMGEKISAGIYNAVDSAEFPLHDIKGETCGSLFVENDGD